jgi:hypothetical protein
MTPLQKTSGPIGPMIAQNALLSKTEQRGSQRKTRLKWGREIGLPFTK